MMGRIGRQPTTAAGRARRIPRTIRLAAAVVAPVLLATLPGAVAVASTTSRTYIVGGTPASEGQYPFFAELLVQTSGGGTPSFSEYCGGALIAESWVLTAAHCVTGDAPAKPDAVLIGRMVTSNTSSGDMNGAKAVLVNPAFNPNTIENDTALIQLDHPSPQAEIRLVDESQDSLVTAGATATVIGLGDTSPTNTNSQPTTVQTTTQTLAADASCRQAIGPSFIASSMLCTNQGGSSPCFGDSGGPLFLTTASGPAEIGVVSHGPATCGSAPSVFSRLTAERTWIRDAIAAAGGPITRLAGGDRVATAIAVSNQLFPAAASAGAVVLADQSAFADALPGTPLAAAKHAPLLLTPSGALDPRVTAEIQRVLPSGGTVYLLGGPAVLDPSIETALSGLGYTPVRYGGANRFATAVMIASQGLGDPTTILEATGLDFPDALAGGAAAAAAKAAILLTDGTSPAPETSAYLSQHPSDTRDALGGPAAAADPAASAIKGADRYATSVAVAKNFFPTFSTFGVADGLQFPDALSGGVHLASLGAPMLLVPPTLPLPLSVLGYLPTTTVTSGWVYGGPAAVQPEMFGELTLLTS